MERKELLRVKNQFAGEHEAQARMSVASTRDFALGMSEQTFESKFTSLTEQKAHLCQQLFSLKTENETHTYLFKNPPCESQEDKTLFTKCVDRQQEIIHLKRKLTKADDEMKSNFQITDDVLQNESFVATN